MIDGTHYRPCTRSLIVSAGLAIVLAGCADTSAVREQEHARINALESELIDAQAAEERRRRSEMRIAERLRLLDAERVKSQQDRQAASIVASENKSDTPSVRKPPVVTQIVVAGATGQDDEQSIWKAQEFPNPVDGTAMCAVVSEPVVVLNGTLDTRVRIIVGKSSVFLRTDATFDTETPETGFRVDAGFPITFDRFHNELTAVIDDSYPRLMRSLENGSTLRASFAYQPQLSSSETHVVEFTLDSFGAALSQLSVCDTSRTDLDSDSVPTES